MRIILCLLCLAGCTSRVVPATGATGAADDDAGPLVLDGSPTSNPDSTLPDDDLRPDLSFPDPVAALSWVTVAAGTFHMGSPDDEPCRLGNEAWHPVTLSRPFEISSTEVTQAAFSALVGMNPSHFKDCGGECPVDSVDWSAALVFCNRLSEQAGLEKCYTCVGDGGKYAFPFKCDVRSAYAKPDGKTIYSCPGFRLPTEAEWERAYRAGTTTAFFNGAISSCHIDSHAGAIAWYSHNSGQRAHGVARRAPNSWNLHDMAGNLWEWVHDWYQPDLGSAVVTDPAGPPTGTGRVIRGGSWMSSPGSLRAASRNQNLPVKGLSFVGFRCARSLAP
jgi:formylglycine-generating enzyme required for sulfatase activity